MVVSAIGRDERRRAIPAHAAATALTSLTGTAPMLVTGDNPRAARRLAAEVGISDVRAGLLPQDKVTAVRDQEEAGRKVLVIGDGVNDAPALGAAHTGIAMGRAGSDLALETADAVIVRDELEGSTVIVGLNGLRLHRPDFLGPHRRRGVEFRVGGDIPAGRVAPASGRRSPGEACCRACRWRDPVPATGRPTCVEARAWARASDDAGCQLLMPVAALSRVLDESSPSRE